MRKAMFYEGREVNRDMILSSSYLAAAAISLLAAVIFLFSTGADSDAGVVRLESRINPNEATVVSLERLPQIGLTRASKIIAYRRAYRGEGKVFKTAADLQKVHGIGSKRVQRLSKYLKFE